MATRFWVGGTGTWDAADTTHWSATSGGAGGASVPTSADTVTFNGSSGGGTVTVDFGGTITIQSLTMGAFTSGTFDNSVNNNNFILTASSTPFSASGTAVRTVRLGTATYTFTAANATASFTTTSNLTLVGSSCNWVFTGGNGQSTFQAGSNQSHGNISVGAMTGTGLFVMTGTNITLASLNFTGTNYAILPSTTITITAPLTWYGTASNQLGFASNSTGASSNITCAVGSAADWIAIRDFAFSNTVTATNSFDGGGNSGITITTPVAVTAGMIGS